MSPETTQILGAAATLYGLGGAFSVLLQARRMLVRGTSGDVSARFFAVYVGGFAVWLLYGIGIGDIPIIVVHAVGLFCGSVTLAVALKLRRPAAVATATRSAVGDVVRARPVQPHPREPGHVARVVVDGARYQRDGRARAVVHAAEEVCV
jgi:MtN3 and saliva related transmembrane protein